MLKERFSMAGKFKSAGEMGLTADISLCVKCGGASQPLLLKTFLQLLTYWLDRFILLQLDPDGSYNMVSMSQLLSTWEYACSVPLFFCFVLFFVLWII